VATTAANIGWQPNGSTQIRATLHYGVDATGVPNAWDFYHVADDATQKDQDLFFSASIDNQTTPGFHNASSYGLTRKREQSQWTTVRQTTASIRTGWTRSRTAISFSTRATLPLTPHLMLVGGFHYENERAAEREPVYFIDEATDRTNYDYLARRARRLQGAAFYTLGGSLEHYSLFGTQTSPPARAYYALRPRKGIFSGTRICSTSRWRARTQIDR
jgi:vitamin B12 transporter